MDHNSTFYINSDSDVLSSPPPLPPPPPVSPPRVSTKIKRPPPVTPRSFRRFFTPRSLLRSPNAGSRSRHALMDLASPALNRRGPVFKRVTEDADKGTLTPQETPRTPRKRKLSFSSSVEPDSSPIRRIKFTPKERPARSPSPLERATSPEKAMTEEKPAPKPPVLRAPIRRSVVLKNSGQLLMRAIGTAKTTVMCDWRDEVQGFYSGLEDHSEYDSLPFCAATCHTNPLVAIGDEQGSIRLFDSDSNVSGGFTEPHLSFRAHGNSIMDLEFSADDRLLATASGDQRSHVIDMMTQTPIYCLMEHTSSLKGVRFQPGNDNVVATCSRDGSISLWDLRVKSYARPCLQLQCSLSSEDAVWPARMKHLRATNNIWPAHGEVREADGSGTGKRDTSVTAITFLDAGRDNLLVSSCASNAELRLWDVRTTSSLRRRGPLPLAVTREPDSHINHRQWGVTSLCLDSTGNRLYSFCRDGTVYAYSTPHLALGASPPPALEATNSTTPRRYADDPKPGLGPIYGFRHPRLRVTSFFVKLAVRPAVGDHSELIAAASSDGCAILFPTDPRYLTDTTAACPSVVTRPGVATSLMTPRRAGLRSASRIGGAITTPASAGSGMGSRAATGSPSMRTMVRPDDTIPIFTCGAALTGGHGREVTSVAWSSGGNELVTVSDDMSVRCWREGMRDEAGALRRLGREEEGEGGAAAAAAARWKCGWADIGNDAGYDEEEA